MYGVAILVSMTAVGVDYGWQPGRDGQLEYIIQIEPELVDALKGGADIVSEIHPEAQGVRRFRVRVGKGPLPRVGGASPGTTPNSPSTYGSAVSGTAGTGNSQAAGAGQGPTSLPGRAGPVLPAAGLAALPLLDLPPPPAIDGDGKVSVLVQPGRNATQEPPGARANPNTAPWAAAPAPRAAGTPLLELPVPPQIGWPDLRMAADELPLSRPATAPDSFTLPPYIPRLGNLPQDTASPAAGSTFGGGWQPPSPASSTGRDILESPATRPPTWPSGGLPGYPPERFLGQPDPAAVQPTQPIPSPNPDSNPQRPIRDVGPAPSPPRGAQPPRLIIGSSEPTGRLPRGLEPPAGEDATDGDWDGAERGQLAAIDRGEAAQKPTMDKETAEELEPRPWKTLIFTSLALFASLAANVYLGWVSLGIYRRYRMVVDRLHDVQAALET